LRHEVGVRCLSLPKQVPAILYPIEAAQEKGFDMKMFVVGL
jgi:hypothetical protein